MTQVKRINLALQGGGAHGAFTWGALDRILSDDRIDIAGISGTSAGALNGAAVKAGIVKNGREGARENLDWVWRRISGLPDLGLTEWLAFLGPGMVARAMEYSLPYMWGEAASRMISPYQFGHLYRNPLEPIIDELDYDCVCAEEGPALFVSATRVRTGKLRVFEASEVTSDVILASACLPTLFRAVEITDPITGRRDAFWDGGYTGNPALFPLFDEALPDDIMVININPLERDEVPRTPQQIQNRINEIGFNSSLLRELRAINFVQRLLDEGTIPEGRMARVLIHMIADDALMNELSVATKVVPNAYIISALRDAGFVAADAWLAAHFDDLNERPTVDLRDMYM